MSGVKPAWLVIEISLNIELKSAFCHADRKASTVASGAGAAIVGGTVGDGGGVGVALLHAATTKRRQISHSANLFMRAYVFMHCIITPVRMQTQVIRPWSLQE